MTITDQVSRLQEAASQKQAAIAGRLVLDTLATLFEHFADTIDKMNLDSDASFEAQQGAEAVRQVIADAAREAAESWRTTAVVPPRIDVWKRLLN